MKRCARCGIATATEHAITDEHDECIEALKTELWVFASWGHETQMLDKAIAKEEASIRLGKDAKNDAHARRTAQASASDAQWKAHASAQRLAGMAELK